MPPDCGTVAGWLCSGSIVRYTGGHLHRLPEVAGRTLADEERHVRFHAQQMRREFAALPTWSRRPVCWMWQLLMMGTAGVVVFDHGAALVRLGVPRRRFTAHVLGGFASAVTGIRRDEASSAAE